MSKTIRFDTPGGPIVVHPEDVAGVLPVTLQTPDGRALQGVRLLLLSPPLPFSQHEVLGYLHQATEPSRLVLPDGPLPPVKGEG